MKTEWKVHRDQTQNWWKWLLEVEEHFKTLLFCYHRQEVGRNSLIFSRSLIFHQIWSGCEAENAKFHIPHLIKFIEENCGEFWWYDNIRYYSGYTRMFQRNCENLLRRSSIFSLLGAFSLYGEFSLWSAFRVKIKISAITLLAKSIPCVFWTFINAIAFHTVPLTFRFYSKGKVSVWCQNDTLPALSLPTPLCVIRALDTKMYIVL